jgi:OmpA-OmpF porin, OOP family
LRTRRQVVDKGTRNWPDENKAIGKLDNDFRNLSEKKIVDPRDYSELQMKYMDVGNRAYKKEVLGSARKQVEDAKNNKAKKYAPRSLNIAELDLKNAENTMDSNVNQPEAYAPAVRKANRSAAMLTAIVEEQKKVNYNLDEGSAQKSFSPSEAEVFRQGDKILIRLKTIGFATGQTDIPAQSKPILERVAQVAEKLDANQVVVEGHTDSVGSAAINETISQKRAESVMSYLQTEGVAAGKIQAVGYGFQKPLSSNKTKTGRAQNRRVDVWISPNEMTETK